MLQILITGFEPFGNSSENSSWAVAERVTACSIEGVDVASVCTRLEPALRVGFARETL